MIDRISKQLLKRFQTCRLLSGNVWNRKLTIIQRRILKRLRNNKISIKRKIYSRENLNSYIQLQTTRKLSLFHAGNTSLPTMHFRKALRTWHNILPFLLNPETRLDVLPVRLHFCETLTQARQPRSHRVQRFGSVWMVIKALLRLVLNWTLPTKYLIKYYVPKVKQSISQLYLVVIFRDCRSLGPTSSVRIMSPLFKKSKRKYLSKEVSKNQWSRSIRKEAPQE